MPQTVDLKEVIEANPKVDPEQLAESQKLSDAMRGLGKRERGDRLALPFARRRAKIVDDLESDPRFVRLCDLKR